MATATSPLTVTTSNTWTNGAGTYAQPVPSAPIGLSAVAVSSTQINLGLTVAPIAATQTEWSYKLTAGSTWTVLSTTLTSIVSLNVLGLTVATSYDFRVRYNALNGYSAYSAITTASTVVAPSVPALSAMTVLGATSLGGSLTVFPANAASVMVQRDTNAGFTAPVTVVTLNNPNITFTDTGLAATTTYYYRASATGAGGTSSYSSVVSATTATSSVVTISGPGLGAKSAITPFFYQPFTTNNGATNVASLGYSAGQIPYGTNAYSSTLAVNTTAGRSTAYGALKLTMPFAPSGVQDRDFFPHVAVDVNNQVGGSMSATNLYLGYWIKFVRVSGSNTALIQLKGPRSGYGAPGTDYYSDAFRYVPNIWLNGDGSFAYLYQETVSAAGTTSVGEHFNFPTLPRWTTGGWNFIEYRMHLNTPGVADGYFKLYVNGFDTTVGWDPAGRSNYDQVRVRESTDSAKMFNWSFLTPGVDIQNMNAATTYELSFAEHYVDTTFMRVVLTNSATYASSTKWAIQPRQVSWTDAQILIATADLNTAGFSSGEAAFLHVIDTNNLAVKTQSFTVP